MMKKMIFFTSAQIDCVEKYYICTEKRRKYYASEQKCSYPLQDYRQLSS